MHGCIGNIQGKQNERKTGCEIRNSFWLNQNSKRNEVFGWANNGTALGNHWTIKGWYCRNLLLEEQYMRSIGGRVAKKVLISSSAQTIWLLPQHWHCSFPFILGCQLFMTMSLSGGNRAD